MSCISRRQMVGSYGEDCGIFPVSKHDLSEEGVKKRFSALQRTLTAVDNWHTQGVSYIDFFKTIPYPAHSILFPSGCRHIGELVSGAIGMYIRRCFSIPHISPDCLYVAHIQHVSPDTVCAQSLLASLLFLNFASAFFGD